MTIEGETENERERDRLGLNRGKKPYNTLSFFT